MGLGCACAGLQVFAVGTWQCRPVIGVGVRSRLRSSCDGVDCDPVLVQLQSLAGDVCPAVEVSDSSQAGSRC